jgi:hypothetical protein
MCASLIKLSKGMYPHGFITVRNKKTRDSHPVNGWGECTENVDCTE